MRQGERSREGSQGPNVGAVEQAQRGTPPAMLPTAAPVPGPMPVPRSPADDAAGTVHITSQRIHYATRETPSGVAGCGHLQDGATDEPEHVADPLRDAWTGMLSRYAWQWFVTLTFRADVHPEAADKRFRQWLKLLRDEHRRTGVLVGELLWARGIERQQRGVLHFHVLLANVGQLRYAQAREFWREGFVWIEPVGSVEAVADYVAKYVTKGGEIDMGGDGIPEGVRVTWPHRTYSRGKVRAALAGLTEAERDELMRWVETDRRPSTRPDALLSRARAAVEAQNVARMRASAGQTRMALPEVSGTPQAAGRVSGPESAGGVPQTVRHRGEHPQDLRSALSPAGAAE